MFSIPASKQLGRTLVRVPCVGSDAEWHVC